MYCSVSNKICYQKKEAQTAINCARHSHEGGKVPIRYYYCRHCNFWHLTSKKFKAENRFIARKFNRF